MSEVRRDIVTDTWVIVDTDTGQLPKDYVREAMPVQDDCPFCEGKEGSTPNEIYAIRDGSEPNKPGWRVRVIANKYPILRIEGNLTRTGVGVYDKVNGIGANEVIIETPKHVTNFFELDEPQIDSILKTYALRIADLHKDQRFRYVLIFKNHGRQAGASTISHLHSELIALPATPVRIKQKLSGAKEYYEYKERCIFCDIIQQELEMNERLIFRDAHFVVIAPYASRFPFELVIFPIQHSHAFTDTTDAVFKCLASVLRKVTKGLYQALENPPYNLILHNSPNLLPHRDYWKTIKDDFHWHIEIVPRTQRTTGFEWGTGFYINRVAPEYVSMRLRELL